MTATEPMRGPRGALRAANALRLFQDDMTAPSGTLAKPGQLGFCYRCVATLSSGFYCCESWMRLSSPPFCCIRPPPTDCRTRRCTRGTSLNCTTASGPLNPLRMFGHLANCSGRKANASLAAAGSRFQDFDAVFVIAGEMPKAPFSLGVPGDAN